MKLLKDKKFWIIVAVTLVIVAVVVYFARKKKTQPETLSLVSAVPSETVLPAANIFPLKFGSRGNEVLTLQKWLNEKLKKQPANGIVAPLPLLVEDGIFGQKTLDALKYKINIDQVDYTYYTKIILGIK